LDIEANCHPCESRDPGKLRETLDLPAGRQVPAVVYTRLTGAGMTKDTKIAQKGGFLFCKMA